MTSASNALSHGMRVAGIGAGVGSVVGGAWLIPAVHAKLKERVSQAFSTAMSVYMINSGLCPTWRCTPIETMMCAAGYKSLSGYPFGGERIVIDNNIITFDTFCTNSGFLSLQDQLAFYEGITVNFPYGVRYSSLPTIHAIAIPLILSGCGILALVYINHTFSIPKCLSQPLIGPQEKRINEESGSLLEQRTYQPSIAKRIAIETGTALGALGGLGTMSYSLVKLLTEKRNYQTCAAQQIFPAVNALVVDLFNKALSNVSAPNRIPCIMTQPGYYYNQLILGQNYYDNSTQQLVTGYQQTVELPLKNLLHKTESCVEAIFWSGDNQKVPIFLFVAGLSLLIMVVVIRKHTSKKVDPR